MPVLNQKRILLIHPLGYHAGSATRDISRIANIMPPIGLASMAAYLATKKIECAIIDCYAQPFADPLIRDYLLIRKPAAIGISCTTSSFLDGVRISAFCKSILPGLRVVFGGPHISALKENTLKHFPVIDFGVVGEGEKTLNELVESGYQSCHLIKGMVFREADNEIIFTGYRDDALQLDRLPFPAYEKLDGYPKRYSLPIFNYPATPNSSCISSRGCPYACSYCDRSVFGKRFRFNSAPYMYTHLKYLRDRFGLRHVNFYDDQFTVHRKRIVALTDLLLDRPIGVSFNCAVRAEHIDFDLLKRLKAAGCWMVSLGIETGDPNLLAQHRHNADLSLLADRIRLIKKAGIRTKGLLMMGLPGETKQTINNSRKYVFRLPIDDLNLTKFTPFPGTPLYQSIRKLGIFEEDWPKMDCMHFLFVPHGMTKQTLESAFTRFYKSHYLRPRVLANYVAMLWRSPDSWIRFLRHLPRFLTFAKSSRRLGG